MMRRWAFTEEGSFGGVRRENVNDVTREDVTRAANQITYQITSHAARITFHV